MKPIRKPQSTPERDRQRDDDVLALAERGWSKAKIGRAFGISRQRVQQILWRLARERRP